MPCSQAAAATLQPGDTVVFRGGVDYRGTVAIPFTGAPGRPITYDGNTAGAFGRGSAVIRGAEPVGG